MSENGLHSDPDGPQNGDGRFCRDFMRNVCNRGKNCKFIHPENAKIRTEPIFCHDFQQQKCFRGGCKFIHCSREDEDHYKSTGELPDAAINTEYYDETRMRNGPNAAGNRKPAVGPPPSSRPTGNGHMNGRNGPPPRRSNGTNDDVPLCKDHLKGICDRPPGGCKFRHASSTEGYGAPSNAAVAKRRPGNTNYYDSGPETKRNHYSTDYEDFNGTSSYNPPPPPPPPQHHQGYSSTGYSSTSYYDTGSITGPATNNVISAASAYAARNGYLSTAAAHGLAEISPYGTASTGTVAAMKALEEENIFLKRRLEEYKKQVNDLVATNEYLLSQNAHLRLNNLKDQATAAAASGGVTLVSMAQPIVMNPSLSVAATQPLSTISSLPTVSMTPVSISQPLPVVSMAGHHSQQQTVFPLVTTQGVLPPN